MCNDGHAGILRLLEFRLLWLAQSVSILGTHVTVIALPLAAVAAFGASPWQVSLLGTLQWLPFLVIGVPAGIVVDRLNRAGIMVVSDLTRALLLAGASAGLVLNLLNLLGLYILVLLVGVFNVLHILSLQGVVRDTVPKDQLMAANGMLNVSMSTGRVAGPFLGGFLTGVIGAATTLAVDAVSFLLSGMMLRRLVRHTRRYVSTATAQSWVSEFRDGWRTVFRSRDQVTLLIVASGSNFFSGVLFVSGVYVLYGTQTLNLSAVAFGAAFAVGSGGAVIGSLVAKSVIGKHTESLVFFWCFVLFGAGFLIVASASGPTWLKMGAITVGHLISTFGFACVNTLIMALLQHMTPAELMGRVGGINRFVSWGVLPLGAFLGGLIAELVDLRAAVLLGGVGIMAAGAWVRLRPFDSLQTDSVT